MNREDTNIQVYDNLIFRNIFCHEVPLINRAGMRARAHTHTHTHTPSSKELQHIHHKFFMSKAEKLGFLVPSGYSVHEVASVAGCRLKPLLVPNQFSQINFSEDIAHG